MSFLFSPAPKSSKVLPPPSVLLSFKFMAYFSLIAVTHLYIFLNT